jgi:MFS transporter, ACS family, D-galactonate transporter
VATSSLPAPARRSPWIVVTLLFLSAVINYIDRGSLSIAAPALTLEFGLSPSQLGLLLSAFFWSYACCQSVAGWLVDRFSVAWVFGIGYLIWSAATLFSGFAQTITALLALRLFVGIGESVAFPAYSRIIVAAFPTEKRGLPNSLVDAGTKLGPAMGSLIGGFLLEDFGWRVLFVVLGAGSLLWFIPWTIWAPRPAVSERDNDRGGPRMLDILRKREAWGTFIGAFSYTYAYFFLLTWLPTYLVQERQLSLATMGVLGAVPFLVSAVAAVLCGWASDAWIRAGGTPTRVRKTFVVTGLLLSMTTLPSAVVPTLTASMLLLNLSYVAFGMYASNHWAITQTLAGVQAAGKWSGIQNTIGALAGVAAPIITGWIVETTGGFFWAFAAAAALAVAGACSYLFVVGPVAPVSWSRRAES